MDTIDRAKPFLLLQSRPETPAADDEYKAFYTYGSLEPAQLSRVRMDQGELPDINLDDYSGVLMGGGPANFAYDEAHKSAMQKAFEPWLFALLERIVAQDKPFFGACLGFGALVKQCGGVVSFRFSEPICAVQVGMSAAGREDPLLAGIPERFEAFVGHKEGVDELPPGVIELARSERCSQMIRIGQNVYGAQFHPELDVAGLALRIQTYKHAGYFEPEEAAVLTTAVQESSVTEPIKILEAFIKRYASTGRRV